MLNALGQKTSVQTFKCIHLSKYMHDLSSWQVRKLLNNTKHIMQEGSFFQLTFKKRQKGKENKKVSSHTNLLC
jgi:hypothetical protein